MSASDSVAQSPAKRGVLEIASSWVGAWGTYVLAFGVFVGGWVRHREDVQAALGDLFGLGPGAAEAVFAIPLLAAAFTATVQRRNRRVALCRRQWATAGPPKPGYFRTTPYQSTDQEAFSRADGAHQRILNLIQRADLPLVYLTGRSGTGKSSLLNAYVVPRLRDAPIGARVVEARVFTDPIADIRSALTAEGKIWKNPPAETNDLLSLLKRAKQHLRAQRLIVILDQFEEFVILHEDEASRKPLRHLLHALDTEPIPGVTIVLVMRSDYQEPTREALLLPLPQLEVNWQEVPLFVQGTARAFLQNAYATAGLPGDLIDRVLEEAADIEENPGLFRPITLNMLGLVISESTNRSATPAAGRLLRDYVRRTLRDPRIRDTAPSILRLMITRADTKRPALAGQLASASGLSPADVQWDHGGP